jgi:hypothetical protein
MGNGFVARPASVGRRGALKRVSFWLRVIERRLTQSLVGAGHSYPLAPVAVGGERPHRLPSRPLPGQDLPIPQQLHSSCSTNPSADGFDPLASTPQGNHHLRNVGDSGGNRAELWPQSAKIGCSYRVIPWSPETEVRKGIGSGKEMPPNSSWRDRLNHSWL